MCKNGNEGRAKCTAREKLTKDTTTFVPIFLLFIYFFFFSFFTSFSKATIPKTNARGRIAKLERPSVPEAGKTKSEMCSRRRKRIGGRISIARFSGPGIAPGQSD